MSETLVHVASGKVRELFTIDDERLLLVASDRISTFDVVLPTEIPDKGRVLTGLSAFWFARTRELCRQPPARAAAGRALDRVPAARDAAARVRRPRLPRRLGLEGLPAQRIDVGARAAGGAARVGPAARADLHALDQGDDRARREHRRRAGARRSSARTATSEVERTALALYRFAAEHAAARGILIADTKFEFGLDADGQLVLADEAFTPDSSRFWPADEYEPGGPQPSFDKQFVRDYCESLGWDKTAPGPELPGDVVAGTRARYVEAFERLTGDRVRRLPRRPGACVLPMRATVLVRPEAGHPRPAGQAVARLAPAPRLRRRTTRGSAGSSTSRSTPPTPSAGAGRGRADVRAAARQPADRELRDRGHRMSRAAPDRRRRRLPGLERRPRRRLGARRPRRRRDARLARRRGAPRRHAARSSCPAASRTATTSAAARSPASRR